jgi:serine/threonine-protein kinase
MAIKLLHSDIADQEMVTRFFNEARAVNEIRHPNIIDIEDFVSAPTGEHYMIMELLEGEDLRAVLAREGTLSPARVRAIGEQLAGALAAVHRVGIIHRDLKPENIFLSRDGQTCKLLDFGVAKFTNDAQGVTRVGMTIGTPAYMAPEQIVTGGITGPGSDIYALGMVMYEALTGHPAFTAPAIAQVLRAHCSEPVTPPSQRRGEHVPATLESVVLKCLAKSAADRFLDCDELEAALRTDRAVEVVSIPAPRSSRWRAAIELPFVLAATAALVLQLFSQGHPAAAAARPDAGVPVAPPIAEPAPAPVAAVVVPQPAPQVVAPAVAPEISLELRAQPSDARFFIGDDRQPLADAPTTVTIPRSSELVSLIARFPDGTEVVQRIVPDRALPAITFTKPAPHPVVSRPVRRAQPVRTKAAGGLRGDREETVDPFTFK